MPQPAPKSSLFRNFLYLLIVFLVLASFLSLYNFSDKPKEISFGELVDKVRQEQVKTIELANGQELTVTLADGSSVVSQKEYGESITTILKNYGITAEQLAKVNVQIKSESGWSYWAGVILPFLLPVLIIGVFIWFMMRQVQGASNKAMMFGQVGPRETNPKDKKKKITFKDVAGVKEAKEELEEVVEFLKHPKKFQALGARVPKGVLLLGSPGTGKTLIARAVAGEANVPFYHISGSEFVEMFVGVGASRVRDLFKKAKKNAPAIVFIDEIDAVGRQRGTGLGGSHDEREQTLNQILVELDGFEPDTGIIVIAATNRPDVLDPALLRPGRFDRQVVVDLPDIKDRLAILKVHAQGKPMSPDADLRELAERTPGFSGADLANLLNEAAILAARKNQKEVKRQDCLDSVEKVLLGPERKSSILSKPEKEITAYHEAGHALLAYFLPKADTVRKVSIISRGRAAGYTLKLPKEDKHLHSRSEFLADISVMLAGHAAEKEIYKEVTTGATNDLQQATRLARKLVTQFGMSDKMGPRTYGEKEEMIFLGREISEQRDYSEETAKLIDSEVNRIITESYQVAQDLIRKERVNLDKITRALIEKETLEQAEFEALLKPTPKINLNKA